MSISDDERMKNYWAMRLIETVTKQSPLITLLRRNHKPPTRWERFTWRMLYIRNRFRDAWLVLIGRKDACDPCEF